MKRTEAYALAKLHRWATLGKPGKRITSKTWFSIDDAVNHGANAVRAIRVEATPITMENFFDEERKGVLYIKHEARAAFRAALSAAGLRSL